MAGGGRTKRTADQSGKAGKGAHMSENKRDTCAYHGGRKCG